MDGAHGPNGFNLKSVKIDSSPSAGGRSTNNGEEKQGWNNFWITWKGRFYGDDTCMDYFSKANLFILCCVAACFTLIIYLAAFSCEVSWILESRGDLPTPAYLLCTFYFILFIASTILIHGLATGLSWGLFCWSIIIGVFSVPELCLVMYMTIQYWGLQSTHGLVELIGYLVRLVITCLTLICVIPTALRWRREKQVLSQLQTLASRLQLTTPAASHSAFTKGNESTRNSGRKVRHSRRTSSSGFDNPGFISHNDHTIQMVPYGYNPYGSQNEFNASIFGLNPSQYIGPPFVPEQTSKRTQSLLDLRYIMTSPQQLITQLRDKTQTSISSQDETDHSTTSAPLNNEVQNMNRKNSRKNQYHRGDGQNGDGGGGGGGGGGHGGNDEIISDPIYYTIDSYKPAKSLGRNCVSLENLNGITTIKNDLNGYGNNLLQNNHYHQQHQWPPIIAYHPAGSMGYQHPAFSYYPQHFQMPITFGYDNNRHNPYLNSSNNSRQSLGNESDDYRKYRDVAL